MLKTYIVRMLVVVMVCPVANAELLVTDKSVHGFEEAIVSATPIRPTPSAVSAANSTVVAYPPSVWANDSSTATLTVTLKDADGNPVSGHDVTLASSGPGSPVITVVNGTTDVDGKATFRVASGTAGNEVFTATDTTEGVALAQTAAVIFVTPPPDLSVYIPESSVIQTWDFTNSQNPGPWQLNRTYFLTEWGIQLGAQPPPAVDNGAWVGRMRIAAPPGLTYFNSGVEMAYYGPAGPPPTSGFEFLSMWHDTPRNGFAILADRLTGTAFTRQQEGSDSFWTIPDNNGSGLAGLHTMALLRHADGTVKTYLDGVLVNTRASTDPATALEWISIGYNVNGNMYMPFGTLISQVRAFTYSPALGPVDPEVSTVVASPSSVWANGLAVSTITVTLKDASGHYIPSKVVSLTKTSGPNGTIITPAMGTSGPNGKAIFTVSSTAVGTNVLTATATTDTPHVALNQKPTVTFVDPSILVISVTIDTAARNGLVGPAGGLGAAWNQQLGTAERASSGLVDTHGVGTSVGFTCGAYNVGSWGSPTLAMLTGGAFTWGDPSDLEVTNLPVGKKYDLYIASYY